MKLEELPKPPLHGSDITAYSAKDPVISQVLNWVCRWWPADWLEMELQTFSSLQHELTLHKKCLLWGNRVIILPRLCQRLLEVLHVGHPGIVWMNALAPSYFWWLGMYQTVEE